MSYHSGITNIFGTDLHGLLGPKADRVPWSSLDYAEQQERLERIPVYVNTRKLGKTPSLIEVVISCFSELANKGQDNPLLGIDLPCFDNLEAAAQVSGVPTMNYGTEQMTSLDVLVKNAAKQRDVFLRHIFKDIIFRFNPGLVFPAIGRKSKNFIFVNDGQHRTLGCIMLGIEQVPINYINSDDEYWDVAQYATINIHSLGASEFDRYRIRVERYKAAVEAGMPIEEEDRMSYELSEIFDDLDITVIEKSDKSHKGNSKVLTGVGNMIKYRSEYGQDYFSRATSINARLFPTCVFHTANSWGLMEFFKSQDKSIDKFKLDHSLQKALRNRWKKDNAGGKLHKDIKDAYKEQTDADAYNSRIPEPVIIAHGIWQVCQKYSPEINWVEPKWPKGAQKFELPLV